MHCTFRMDDLSSKLDKLERILDGSKRPSKLKLSVLRLITANFTMDRKIGEGGCGNVYKGILPERNKIVAVKKLFNRQTIDEKLFQQEVTTLMNVEHPNIVQFIGFCSHTEQQAVKMTANYILADERERLLCFEYMSNGSLEDHITDELRGLPWEERFQIIRGICEGLSYLHNKKGIIHMDLKPPNILLTDGLAPKITDFGISRLGETAKTMSKIRAFTPIYCCPEYRLDGERSFKSDIYSLGVTITEIVTGTIEDNPDPTKVCRRWRHRWNKSAQHTSLFLRWQKQVTECLKLAQRCKSWKPTKRPDILDIIHELNEMNSSDASKSIVEQQMQKHYFLDDMLGIKPLELHFTPKLNEQISHSIQLTNGTEDYVAFRIPLEEKTVAFGVYGTTRLPFRIHPNKGIVPPRSLCSVTIKLDALMKPMQEQCVAKLCVQSITVDKGLTTNDITADMFEEEPKKMIDVVNLTVKVSAPKRLLVVEPLELRYWPIELNKLLPCLLQLTNMTDDYVAFITFVPQGKVLYYQAMGKGGGSIMPPYSTRGVITEIFVTEEALAEMRCKDTCLLRSVVVNKDLMDDDVSEELFNEQTGVHEMELDIVFAELPQTPSSVHRPKQDWEDDELELTRDQAVVMMNFLSFTWTNPTDWPALALNPAPAHLHMSPTT